MSNKMTNEEAIKLIQGIEEDGRNITTEHLKALDLAIEALEEAQLDIKLLKMDLPELFRPSYDGGYLRGEEND